MRWFQGLDEGFYWIVLVFILAVVILVPIFIIPNLEERMAKLGYVQKVVIVTEQTAHKVWVKENGEE